MRAFALFLATVLLASPVIASVLKLEDGSRVAAEIKKGSRDDVFVLINGLIYATDRWDDVANGLQASGATVIRYALPGQPENLRLLRKGEEPKYFATGLELDDMVENLRLILKAAHITSKVHLVGLSYGASVAAEFAKAHADQVADVTFIAPLVIPTDEYDAGGASLRASLESIRFWENTPCTFYGAFNPWLCVGHDYWFDTFFKAIHQSYLEGRIQDIPDGVDAEIYKKAVFHLVRAARDFDLRQKIQTLHHVSMLVASLDEKSLAADQRRAWANVPTIERGEFVVFKGAHHALPDEAPTELTAELLKIAHGEF
jgi:pimeloyl-ACP methyl ester carboxylesterase